jgi:hypothetical protein
MRRAIRNRGLVVLCAAVVALGGIAYLTVPAAAGDHPHNATTALIIRTTTTAISAGTAAQSTVFCLHGESATGGGGDINGGSANDRVIDTLPLPADSPGATPIGWKVIIFNGDPTQDKVLTAYVICARPT